MTKEYEIKLLMHNGYTKIDAKKHLENGSIIYYDLIENLEIYLEEWSRSGWFDGDDEEETEANKNAFKTAILNHQRVYNWDILTDERGKIYYFSPML